MIKRRISYLLFCGFLGVCYFPLFLHLDTWPLRLWDEARLAINAFEMLQNKEWIVTYFEQSPDLWNTKPPLMIWLQAIGMQLLGYNELAVRLPAALAGLATILLIYFFCKRVLKNQTLGYLAALILLTSPGFVSNHVTRTGDYDALLVFWNCLTVLLLFKWSQQLTQPKNHRWLYLAALSCAAAVLTKSVAGLLLLPGVFIFLLWKKQVLPLLRSPHTYGAILLFVSLVAAYYVGRESLSPGYWQAVWDNELGGRYLSALEGNGKPFFFHFQKLWDSRFLPWLYFIPLGLWGGFQASDKIKNALVCNSITVLTFLIISSFSKTKLIWYDASAFPLLAIIAAYGLFQLWKGLQTRLPESRLLLTYSLAAIFLLTFFGHPYYKIVRKGYAVEQFKRLSPNASYAPFMEQFRQEPAYSIFHPHYNGQISFYRQAFQLDGQHILDKQFLEKKTHKKRPFPSPVLQFAKGEKVMICEASAKKLLRKHYKVRVVKKWKSCEFLIIN